MSGGARTYFRLLPSTGRQKADGWARKRTTNLPEESTTLNRLRRADTPMNKAYKTTNKLADGNRSSTTPIIKQHKFHSSFFIKTVSGKNRLYSFIYYCLMMITDKF